MKSNTKETHENATLLKDNGAYTIFAQGKTVAGFYEDNAVTLYDCFDDEYQNCIAILYFENEDLRAIQVMQEDGTLVLLAKF